MKKIGILALIALFTMSFSVFSQPQQQNRNGQSGDRQGAPRGMNLTPQERADNLTKQLTLTDAQKVQLVEFYQKQEKMWQEKRAEREKQGDQIKQNKTREELKAEREKDMAVQDAELEKIIGKDKMTEYKKIRQQRMDKMNENRSQRSGMNS